MVRGYQVGQAAAVSISLASCGTPPEPPPADAPVIASAAPARGALPVVTLRLEPPTVSGTRAVERAGLVTALVELGLADLEGVVPSVGEQPPSPGLRDLVLTDSEAWTARLSVTIEPWEVGLELCDPAGECRGHSSTDGAPATPWPAVSALLQATSARMLRQPAAGAVDDWGQPVSADEYAVLVAGRSAATFYGMRPPVPATAIGDSRRDPIARAAFIDPGMAIGGWLLARREIERGNTVTGRSWLVRGALARPSSLVLMADEGAALSGEGKSDAAVRVWRSVRQRAPEDLRFVAPAARALLANRSLDEAAKLLDGWSDEVLHDRTIAELRVALAEAGRELARYDDLLRAWQEADPTTPEPVRRRIRIRVRKSAYQAALDMVAELRQRGAGDEAVDLEIALLAALGRLPDAADRAERGGRADVARRLRARAALQERPNIVPDSIIDDPAPEARVAAGRARLRGGDAAGALRDAEAALVARRFDVAALTLRAEASAAVGDRGASRAAAELAAMRPQGSFVSPRTAAGATGTRGQPQSP